MKFVMTQAVCKEGIAKLEQKKAMYYIGNGNPDEYLEEMKDADALIVRIAKCDKNVIENSPNLKVIGRTGVGYDSVDVEAATKAGIPVVITPGANNRSVAEHAVAMMFAISKNFYEAETELRKGNWNIRDAKKAFELLDKKVGFIGLGAIGREAQKICKAIGMQTLGYDPYLSKEKMEEIGCLYFEDYHDMIKECDFVSIHVPLVESTANMIAKKELESMKKTAVLINCSRGGIVNEKDLIDALNNDVIAAAGTDVFEQEPITEQNPLLKAKNLMISPHSAAQTQEAVINMASMCIEGCFAVLNGEQWPYVADKKVYEHQKWKK
ncbi:hydroxyacid dehydrogenase [Clostridium sp. MD294]|uniref:hydroxyacid dehydrogenase n=1 Tax=Clostridium sp. MD294 TaxID=97138 RepID=UPI0002CC84FB|nr:hydroxyacid dehydrogenase [Clostridium sp. MD294]NDO45369.1 hydroxyacid dehydrogenase [Clostridium sp. MD294]USF30990.1 Hydroxypyruvate reductase [Clostridium sp. MD294]